MGANAQTSVPTFTSGSVLTAEQQNWINTGIPVFATTVTRDAAFGGTGEKTLAQGQYAYIEATSSLQVYSGSAWVAAAGGGLAFVKSQVPGTTVTSVSVTAAFSATYDNYLITLSNNTCSISGALYYLKFGGSTGSTYSSGGFYNDYSTVTNTARALSASSNGLYLCDTSATASNSLAIIVENPFTVAPTTYNCQFANQSWGGYYCGRDSNSASQTDFSINVSGGYTMTGGVINVYGLAKS
jgi:hypothetical protein